MKRVSDGTKVRILWDKLPKCWKKDYGSQFKRLPKFGVIHNYYRGDYTLWSTHNNLIGTFYRREFEVVNCVLF